MSTLSARQPHPEPPPARSRGIRALVVDPVGASRLLLRTLLAGDDDIEVVGEAADLAEAIALAQRVQPDVVTMDLQVAEADGCEAIDTLMRAAPSPVVAITRAGDDLPAVTIHALRSGAVAVVACPELPGHPGFGDSAAHLLATVKSVAAPARMGGFARVDSQCTTLTRIVARSHPRPEVLAIATSTGGMMALGALLTDLPTDFPLPVLVVHHPTAGMADVMATWLSATTEFEVDLATDGAPLRAGTVYLAGEDAHLLVDNEARVRVDRSAPVGGDRPSADLLFEAVARVYGAQALGLVLTGSHVGGVRGLERIRAAGGQVIVQNEATSVGFELGAAVMAAGLPDYVLPLDQIPLQLARLCG